MRLLFTADGRSPTAMSWIQYFIERGDEVFLASTFSSTPPKGLKGYEFVPAAFSGVKNNAAGAASSTKPGKKNLLWGTSTLQLRTVIRQWLGPLTIPRSAISLRKFIQQVNPDLVHAMRIPYEGMLAAEAGGLSPLLVSVWGNDFTLHAPSSPWMGHYTRSALRTADGLHADCTRDIRLGKKWGFSADKPSLVIPGSGGIRTGIFYPADVPADQPLVIQPRGFRAYVNNQAFFRAIPLVLKERPDARFICPSMAGEKQVLLWITDLGIGHAVELTPPCSQAELADLFRSAQVIVSPTTHDGTPNSLLEAMACGCFPAAGDLESIREWITPGQNGLLFDASDPQQIADAILQGLNDQGIRKQAASINKEIIAERGEYKHSMGLAVEFYKKLIK